MSFNNQEDQKRILGATGDPIPVNQSWLDRLNDLVSGSRKFIASMIAAVAVLAVFIGNVDSIEKHFSALFSRSIPPIEVNLFNTGKYRVGIPLRGDFILFLPGSGAAHVMGKYEMQSKEPSLVEKLAGVTPLNQPEIVSGFAVVPPNRGVLLRMNILNEKFFEQYFSRGDCDVSFIFRYSNGEHVPSTNKRNDDRPFTAAGLKGTLIVDVNPNVP